MQSKQLWREKCSYGLSASQFGMALGFCGKVSDFVHYMRHMVGTDQEFVGNAATAHGIRTESTARCCYEALLGTRVFNGGFFPSADGFLGASPDGIIFYNSDDPGASSGDHQAGSAKSMRLLEIKCPFIALYDGSKPLYQPFGIPLQYMCQMQGQMALSGAKQCDFFVFLKGPPLTQVVAWRVLFSEEFWAWCRPKLLQVVQWLKDGPSQGLDRTFAFEEFDFSRIDVRPLVFPFDLTKQEPIVDLHRFPFFFSRLVTTAWMSRNRRNPEVVKDPIRLEARAILSRALLAAFGGNLRQGSLVFCGCERRILVVASVNWDSSLMVLFYWQALDEHEGHQTCNQDELLLSTVVVRFFDTDMLCQLSLVCEAMTREQREKEEKVSSPSLPPAARLLPVSALAEHVEPGDVVELAASCNSTMPLVRIDESTSSRAQHYFVDAVWNGLRVPAADHSRQNDDTTPYGLLLRIVPLSPGGVFLSSSGNTFTDAVSPPLTFVVPHYYVKRKVKVEPSSASSSGCMVMSASTALSSSQRRGQRDLEESTAKDQDGKCKQRGLGCEDHLIDAVHLADILVAPDCGQIIFLHSVSDEPDVLLRKRASEGSQTTLSPQQQQPSTSLRVVVVSLEGLLLMIAHQSGLERSSPLCIDDDDDVTKYQADGEAEAQADERKPAACAMRDSSPRSTPGDENDISLTLLKRQCTEEVVRIHPCVAGWARRLLHRDSSVVVVCLCCSVTSSRGRKKGFGASPSLLSNHLRSVRSQVSNVLFVDTSLVHARAVVDGIREQRLPVQLDEVIGE